MPGTIGRESRERALCSGRQKQSLLGTFLTPSFYHEHACLLTHCILLCIPFSDLLSCLLLPLKKHAHTHTDRVRKPGGVPGDCIFSQPSPHLRDGAFPISRQGVARTSFTVWFRDCRLSGSTSANGEKKKKQNN